MQLISGLQFIHQLCFLTRGHPLPVGTGANATSDLVFESVPHLITAAFKSSRN